MAHLSIKLFLVYAVSIIVFEGISLSFPLYLLLLVVGWGISLAAYGKPFVVDYLVKFLQARRFQSDIYFRKPEDGAGYAAEEGPDHL